MHKQIAITQKTGSLDYITSLNRRGEPISRKWSNVMNFATFLHVNSSDRINEIAWLERSNPMEWIDVATIGYMEL